MSALEATGLELFYGDVQAVWGASFRVAAGEIVTLIGANGAGKTTTMRALAGLLEPRAGRITFAGEDVTKLPAHQRVSRGLVLVPEARQLWAQMTVLENLQVGAHGTRARPLRKATLERVLTLFPALAKRLSQQAGTLSGGEQQMCAIGRGLMAQPTLLMLDEPTLGLAPLLVKEVFRALRDINGAGTTLLLVEQNVQHALRLAHRAYVLETGRMTLEGQAADLLVDPSVRERFLGQHAL
jgi:branched-chain amino acid transport system ATP-binding protein